MGSLLVGGSKMRKGNLFILLIAIAMGGAAAYLAQEWIAAHAVPSPVQSGTVVVAALPACHRAPGDTTRRKGGDARSGPRSAAEDFAGKQCRQAFADPAPSGRKQSGHLQAGNGARSRPGGTGRGARPGCARAAEALRLN